MDPHYLAGSGSIIFSTDADPDTDLDLNLEHHSSFAKTNICVVL